MSNIGSLTIWEKSNTKLFIDFGTSLSPNWVRLGKSTVLSLTMNPETENFDFIEDETPTQLIKNYRPSMDQHSILAQGDAAFDELFEMYLARPVGAHAVKNVLIVYPKSGMSQGSFLATSAKATIAFKSYDAVNRKLSFDMNFSGLANGIATFSSGVPSFTESDD